MVSDSVRVVGTSTTIKDEHLYEKLKEELKAYIERELGAKTVGIRETHKPDINFSKIEKIADTPLAAFIVSYMSFVHQEKQDQTNTKLQRYVLLVAVISVVSAISSVIVAYLKP